MLGDKGIRRHRMVKRVFAAAAVFCLMCIPAFVMERNVWTCSTSGEIYFELADEPDVELNITMEDLTTPENEETNPEEALQLPVNELNEFKDENLEEIIKDEDLTSIEEQEQDFIDQDENAVQTVKEPDEELTDENN